MNDLRKLLARILCVVLVCGMLPAAASAVETRKEAYDGITFNTFANLQELASGSYEELTLVYYVGKEPLVIRENLTLPDLLYVLALDRQITVPAGVTLTAVSEKYPNGIYADRMTVAGTLDVDTLEVESALTVTGTLNNHNVICLNGETQVSGAERIHSSYSWSTVCRQYDITDMTGLKAAVADTDAAPNASWRYQLNIGQADMLIDASLVIPENCELYIDYFSEPITVTVAGGCVLDLACDTWIFSALEVKGTVICRGTVEIYDDLGGSMTISDGGYYLGDGEIFVTGEELEAPAAAVPGLELEDFRITREEQYSCWKLESVSHHTPENFTTAVTAPTCVDRGYTTCRCPQCGDSYRTDYTLPTGIHTYSDDGDTTCNVCGAIRAVRIRTVPMFRLFNPNTGEHFYTGSEEERDSLVAVGWNYEGVAWNAPVRGGEPVYRCFNPNSGDHHYTMSREETVNLMAAGWNYEGVAWNSAAADGNVPQYRLYNPNAQCGIHHYTSSTEERDYLVNLGWIFEGIGWYGLVK